MCTLLLGALFLITRAQPALAGGVVGDGTPASCTEAMLDAALAGGGMVTFNCGPEPVTITLTSQKVITADTIIDGGGLIALSGGGAVRVFAVSWNAALDVRNLTIADGRSDADGVVLGGGIHNTGALTLTNCTLNDNSAVGVASFGGGIYNSGTLMLTNCTLSGNQAQGRGSYGSGGGIANSGVATLTNCTLSGNSADHRGGAIDNGGTVTLTNCTLGGNSATNGSGISNAMASPVSGGGWGTLTLRNTIIGNSPSGGDCTGYYPAITDGGHNLIEDAENACGLTNGVNGNIIGVDPLLDPAGLQDNGGPTQTIALQAGSPAIDAGDPDVCANAPVNGVDQRGYARPGTGFANCSIGAFEYNSSGPPIDCLGDCDGGGDVTVDELITLVNIALGSTDVPECDSGDANDDGTISVDELVRAVIAALVGCRVGPVEQACLDTGGTVGSASCCLSAGDFPNTCAIGACSCAPNDSHEVAVCNCGVGSCFDGTECIEE